MTDQLLSRLRFRGPKRILSLDGGGIRGCATLGYLEHIEEIIRERMSPEATLADYFDLIGGTSTGAIIATLLALGHSVAEVRQRYLELGPNVFSRRTLWARLPWLGPKLFTAWSVKPLEQHAKRLFSEKTTLGSPSMHTGLCIVTMRADTVSVWPYFNHPGSQYYKDNADIPLWKLIRATSAAPTYFRPIKLDVGEPGKPDYGIFIDGGVSIANNPALLLFELATLKGFRLEWATGADKLLLVSVGTGRFPQRLREKDLLGSQNVFWAHTVPEILMHDASEHNERMLQYLSESPTARRIDWETGDLKGDLLGGQAQLSYVRYNVEFEQEELRAASIETTEKELRSLRDMSAGANARRLYEIGKACAKQHCRRDHFPAGFDPTQPPAVKPGVFASPLVAPSP